MTRRAWGPSLLAVLILALSLMPASAQPTATATPTSVRMATSWSTAEFRNELTRYINLRRQKVGCKTLVARYGIFDAAYKHTNRMAAKHKLSHQLPGEPSLGVRANLSGYTGWKMLAENLAYGASTPWDTYVMWMRSKPHRTNIQNCYYKDIGLAVKFKNGRPWVTADFGRR